jgi:hypothetical protein
MPSARAHPRYPGRLAAARSPSGTVCAASPRHGPCGIRPPGGRPGRPQGNACPAPVPVDRKTGHGVTRDRDCQGRINDFGSRGPCAKPPESEDSPFQNRCELMPSSLISLNNSSSTNPIRHPLHTTSYPYSPLHITIYSYPSSLTHYLLYL